MPSLSTAKPNVSYNPTAFRYTIICPDVVSEISGDIKQLSIISRNERASGHLGCDSASVHHFVANHLTADLWLSSRTRSTVMDANVIESGIPWRPLCCFLLKSGVIFSVVQSAAQPLFYLFFC